MFTNLVLAADDTGNGATDDGNSVRHFTNGELIVGWDPNDPEVKDGSMAAEDQNDEEEGLATADCISVEFRDPEKGLSKKF